MRKTLLALAIAGVTVPVAHADEWFVEAHYADGAALARAAAQFQHVRIDTQRQVLQVDTDENGIAALEDAGLSVSIDAAGTARLRGFEATMQQAIASHMPQLADGGYPGIPGNPLPQRFLLPLFLLALHIEPFPLFAVLLRLDGLSLFRRFSLSPES